MGASWVGLVGGPKGVGTGATGSWGDALGEGIRGEWVSDAALFRGPDDLVELGLEPGGNGVGDHSFDQFATVNG